jgi:glutathione synthase
MKICFVVNGVESETVGTTVYMMHEAWKRKHTVYLMGVGDFSFTQNQDLSIISTYLPKNLKPRSPEEHLKMLQGEKAKIKKILAKDLDVLFIRNNPTEEGYGRHWAEPAGVAFGRLVQKSGVLVLNDAFALSNAFIDKLYFEELPIHVKPASVITRNKQEILDFFEEHRKKMILKPLEGSGGRGVYYVDKNERNLNQIIENLTAQGYIIAQQYLSAAKEGDVRVLVLNGKILQKGDKYGIIKRVSGEGEFRSNLTQGARPETCELTEHIQKIADVVGPKLKRDGHFFVGLDVVKDKLIEINVLSPGGLDGLDKIGVDNFSDVIIEAIERKIEYKKLYGPGISNRELATME